MDNNRFTELLNLYLLDRITDLEGAELAVMLQVPDFQDELQRRIGEQLQNREFELEGTVGSRCGPDPGLPGSRDRGRKCVDAEWRG